MRNKIYQMVHVYEGNAISVIYKYFMISVIALSLIPLVAMLSSFFGIAIVALPAGIVTAEYLGSLKEENCNNR